MKLFDIFFLFQRVFLEEKNENRFFKLVEMCYTQNPKNSKKVLSNHYMVNQVMN